MAQPYEQNAPINSINAVENKLMPRLLQLVTPQPSIGTDSNIAQNHIQSPNFSGTSIFEGYNALERELPKTANQEWTT
jgi:hypothetical protein